MLKEEFDKIFDTHDRLVCQCLTGKIPFGDFERQYDSFYVRFALDGHESDPVEQALIESFESRIAIHRDIWTHILTRLCSDSDADNVAYRDAGFFGSKEALLQLQALVKAHDLRCDCQQEESARQHVSETPT